MMMAVDLQKKMVITMGAMMGDGPSSDESLGRMVLLGLEADGPCEWIRYEILSVRLQ